MTILTQSPRTSLGRIKRRLPRLAFAALLFVMSGALLAACGGDPSSTSSGTGGTGGQSSANQSGIKFASCMRANGVSNFPDSAVTVKDGRTEVNLPPGIANSSQFQSAMQSCRKDLPNGGNGVASHSNTQKLIKFANCMRAHGVPKFPEPNAQGREQITGSSGVNPNSPQFQSALATCQHLLPAGAVNG